MGRAGKRLIEAPEEAAAVARGETVPGAVPKYRLHPRVKVVKAEVVSERIVPKWQKGGAPPIPPGNRAIQGVLHNIDAAETPREWNGAIAQLVELLFLETMPNASEEEQDIISSISSRIGLGFKPLGHRPAHVIQARNDALWLADLARDTTLPEAIRYLAEVFGITPKRARDRVLRAEKEMGRQFTRTARAWRR
jgi:hypothetical protein